MKRWSQSNTTTQLWIVGDGSKVWCCKEQYCIGTWNVRSMNQGKLLLLSHFSPTLCDPIDGSRPGSSVPGILQASILEWVAISFSSQGKLEVVKQEMARVNINILGIRELKWTEWVSLTQMTIISTTVGKNPFKEMHHSHQKILKCSTWMQSQKQQNDLYCLIKGKPSNITVIQV